MPSPDTTSARSGNDTRHAAIPASDAAKSSCSDVPRPVSTGRLT